MSKKKAPSRKLVPAKPVALTVPADLLTDVRSLIEQARDATARAVNSALVLLYWEIGTRIRRDILKEQRAEYGEHIVPTLSAQLAPEYGEGFGKRNLFRMIQFAEVFPEQQIVSTVSKQLGWSHFVEIVPLEDELKRDFYAEMCRVERWSVRTLRDKIAGMLFERTALSKKPVELAKQELARLRTTDQLSPDLVFRDPYFLDFLGLKDTYIDLLFYHRKLRRSIVVDLKLAKFQAADKGQMELYLRWLEKHETEPGEQSPLGLILCEYAGHEQVELLQLEESSIRVAGYLTELPPKALLQKKLRQAAELCGKRLKEGQE